MELDEILNRIGGFGRVQIVLYILLGILGIPCGMQNLGMVFFGASMDHWCQVDGLSDLSPQQVRTVSAVYTEDGALDGCSYYKLDYSLYSNETLLSWNRTVMLDNITETVKCDSWYYDYSEFKSTVRSKWDLVCSKSYVKTIMQTCYMIGFLVGAGLFGIVSDRFGRLKTMCLCLLLQIILALVATVISVYWHYMAFLVVRVLVGVVTAGLFTVTFVLVMEIISPKYRTYTGLFFQGFFAIGFCTLPGISYALRDLLHTQLAMCLPTILLLSYYWIVPESPRWLIQQGRFDEAEKILRKIARLNKLPLPEDFSIKPLNGDIMKEDSTHTSTIIDVLKNPTLRRRWFISAYCWFVCGLAYYGISYSAESLGGDLFLNSLISGLVEFPAYILCFFIVGQPKIGRKFSMAGSFFVGGVSLLICIPLLDKPDLQIVLLCLANIGKLGASAAFAIVYIFTAEIFPTVVRSASVGTCSMCARVGALLASPIMLLWNTWYGIPYIIFGVMGIMGGLLTLLLPESVNEILPETIKDGEMFGTKEWRQKHHLSTATDSNGAANGDVNVEGEEGAEMTLLDDQNNSKHLD